MRKLAIIFLLLAFIGCKKDNAPRIPSNDIHGTWKEIYYGGASIDPAPLTDASRLILKIMADSITIYQADTIYSRGKFTLSSNGVDSFFTFHHDTNAYQYLFRCTNDSLIFTDPRGIAYYPTWKYIRE
jgi:hypothetical protein